jgi:hypothetical protein
VWEEPGAEGRQKERRKGGREEGKEGKKEGRKGKGREYSLFLVSGFRLLDLGLVLCTVL